MGKQRQPIVLSDSDLQSDGGHEEDNAGPQSGSQRGRAWEALILSWNHGKSKSKSREVAQSAQSQEDAVPEDDGAASLAKAINTTRYRAPRMDVDSSDLEGDVPGSNQRGGPPSQPAQKTKLGTMGPSTGDDKGKETRSIPPRLRKRTDQPARKHDNEIVKSASAEGESTPSSGGEEDAEAVRWVENDDDDPRNHRKQATVKHRTTSMTRSPPHSQSPSGSEHASDNEDMGNHQYKSSEPPRKAAKQRENSHARGSEESRKKTERQRKHIDEVPRFINDGNSRGNDSSGKHTAAKASHKHDTANSNHSRKSSKRHGKVAHGDLEIEDASSSASDSEDSGIDIVPPTSGKLKLGDQHRRVRRVLTRAIFTMLTDICIKNAFPDGSQDSAKIIYRAMLKAAAEFGYGDMVNRLKKKDDYSYELVRLPAQRISTLRGNNKTIEDAKPYSPPMFVKMLRVAFFKCPTSFGFKISQRFESTLPDKPDEKEIPAPMLALVATTLHAAIDDCKQGYKQPRNFSTNDYSGIYTDHIQELSAIRVQGPTQYHVLMYGLWRQISMPLGERGRSAQPRKSFLNIEAMARE
ncbi:hypothetical protein C8Q73DRAFT_664233 [Cubamyces lactineus]|nr:hypothetical protein C8Q73DRAFT_664233 [Cubamyces lactineus]